MANNNTVTMVGNLVEDPELRFTPSGVGMARLRIAVNRRWRNQNNEWQEDTSFFTATCWRDLAEHVAESLSKGTRVLVTGRMEQRSWETQDGERRSVVELSVEDIGPSLRFATATVTRTPKADGEWGEPVAVPAAPVARDDFGPDEAPF